MLKAAAAAKNSAFHMSLQNRRLSDVLGPLAAASDFGNNPSVLTKFGNNGHASVGWAFLPSSHLSPSPLLFTIIKLSLWRPRAAERERQGTSSPRARPSPPVCLCILMRPQRRARVSDVQGRSNFDIVSSPTLTETRLFFCNDRIGVAEKRK